MKKKTIIIGIILGIFGLHACGQEEETGPAADPRVDTPAGVQDSFMRNLSMFCGETFSGEATYPDEPDHPLVATELRTHLSSCDDEMIRIELYRDGDYWHGAWVLQKRDQGLHLFHDHLGEVRTEEDLGDDDYHGYGGYADERGTTLRQYFPADQVTADMIPEAATNVWMIEMDPEEDRFIYYLERHDQPRFRAELTRE